jgi:hypothetical protein
VRSADPIKSFDLSVGKIVDGPFFVPLGGHRQYLLAMMQELRFINGDIFEERTDRCQACVAASRAVSTSGFDERQEASDQVASMSAR